MTGLVNLFPIAPDTLNHAVRMAGLAILVLLLIAMNFANARNPWFDRSDRDAPRSKTADKESATVAVTSDSATKPSEDPGMRI